MDLTTIFAVSAWSVIIGLVFAYPTWVGILGYGYMQTTGPKQS